MKISKEFKVGLISLIAGVGLYFGFNFLKGIDFFTSTDKYYVVYSNISGLTESNAVTLNGMSIGRVSNIQIDQSNGNQILVELEIDNKIIIGDSTVAWLYSDFISGETIVLQIGDVKKPMQAGDTLIGQLNKGLEDILKESAVPVSDNIESIIRKLNGLLDNFEGSGDMVKEQLEALKITNKELQLTLRQTRVNLSDVSGSLIGLLNDVKKTNQQLRPVLAKYGQVADTLKAIQINQTLDKLEQTLASIQLTFDNLNSPDGTINKLMTDSTTYHNLNTLLKNFDSLANHIDSYPKHFLGPLGKSHEKVKRDLEKQKELK